MKKYMILFIAISLLLLSSCTALNGEGDGAENAVYMGNPNSSGIISMTVSNETGGSTVITPRLANITDEPVTITVAIDKKTLEDYNKKYSLALEAIDAEDFIFVTKDGKETTQEASVTVEKGNFEASVEVKMKSVNEKKYPFSKSFAIPVIIKNASKYQVLSAPKWTIVRLNRKLKTSVGLMSGGDIVVTPKTPFPNPMTEWTFQMSVIYSTLTRDNLTTAYMRNAGGGGEFYTRIWHDKGIQVKNIRDGADTWTQRPLSPEVWLQISYVYKNATISVYVNGELQKKFETTPIYLSNQGESGWAIGNGNYRNDYIREIRFWNKALTEAEILDKLYLPQEPTTPGLLMYMPVTKESELNELTGNWIVTKNKATKISYVENVIFPANKLVIEE